MQRALPHHNNGGFTFLVAYAERTLDAAVAFQERALRRHQKRDAREKKMAARVQQKRLRAELEKQRAVRRRLQAEKGMTMAEIMQNARPSP